MCHSSTRKFVTRTVQVLKGLPVNDEKLILWQVWCELVIVVAVQLLAYTQPNIVSFISWWWWSRHQAPVTGLSYEKIDTWIHQISHSFYTKLSQGFLCMNCILNWRAEMIMHIPIHHPFTLVAELRWRWSLFDNGVQDSMSPSKLWASRYRSKAFHQLLELFMCMELASHD